MDLKDLGDNEKGFKQISWKSNKVDNLVIIFVTDLKYLIWMNVVENSNVEI